MSGKANEKSMDGFPLPEAKRNSKTAEKSNFYDTCFTIDSKKRTDFFWTYYYSRA